MPTPAEIINIYPTAQYLCAVDILRSGLNDGGIDRLLPLKIQTTGERLQDIFDNNPSDTSITKVANYLYALMGLYGTQALGLSGNVGSIAGVVSVIPVATPNALEFEVSATSIIPTGGSTVTLQAFIGYNIIFARNNVTQSTINNGGSYYSWNRSTGEFQCFGNAAETELFTITPV